MTLFVSPAEQWKLLGQEKDGSILIGWVEESERHDAGTSCTVIGRYDQIDDKLQVRLEKGEYLSPRGYLQCRLNPGTAPLFGGTEHCSSYGQPESYSNGIRDKAEESPGDIGSPRRSLLGSRARAPRRILWSVHRGIDH